MGVCMRLGGEQREPADLPQAELPPSRKLKRSRQPRHEALEPLARLQSVG